MPERAELLEALRDPDPDVRRRAARALDHLPLDQQTVEALIALARRETIPAVRSAAVHVLACEGCKPEACQTSHDIVGFLIDILHNDVSADVRRQTIEGLRSAATQPRVQAALRAALNDAAFKIRWKAACVILPFEERETLRASRGAAAQVSTHQLRQTTDDSASVHRLSSPEPARRYHDSDCINHPIHSAPDDIGRPARRACACQHLFPGDPGHR